jgi:hypothetical protein
MWPPCSSVTRSGEFSPNRLFSASGCCMKIAEVAHNFGDFTQQLSYALVQAKKWVGLHFGRSFHKHIRSPCRAAKPLQLRMHAAETRLCPCDPTIAREKKMCACVCIQRQKDAPRPDPPTPMPGHPTPFSRIIFFFCFSVSQPGRPDGADFRLSGRSVSVDCVF